MTVRHTGYADPAAAGRKLDRDGAILERELAERPDDPFVLFNLGSIAVERGDWPRGAATTCGGAWRARRPTDSITRKLHALIARAATRCSATPPAPWRPAPRGWRRPRRRRPPAGRDSVTQRGLARLAEAGADGDPGRNARAFGEDEVAVRTVWERWQEGLTIKPTLLSELPPLQMLLVLDNLAGHKTPAFVCWLFAHGIMPLYTPLGGSWLNMAESIQRVLKRRALDGQHPSSTDQIIAWFEAVARHWYEAPTPFVWGGKRAERRRRQRQHRLGGSGAYTRTSPRLGAGPSYGHTQAKCPASRKSQVPQPWEA